MNAPTESATLLKAIFTRLRNLDEERQAIAEDVRHVLKEARSAGFHPPVLTLMVRRARKDPQAILEGDGLLETYEAITGTGAGAGGTLRMERGADGVFQASIGPPADAEEKLTKATKTRLDAMALAALAAAARGDGD